MQTRVKCINGIGNVYFPAMWKTSVKLNVFKSSAIEKILSSKPERTRVTPASHLYLPSANFWTITPACGNTGDTKWRTCQRTVRIALTPKIHVYEIANAQNICIRKWPWPLSQIEAAIHTANIAFKKSKPLSATKAQQNQCKSHCCIANWTMRLWTEIIS